MRSSEFLLAEGFAHPVICVDVQPEYSGMNDGDESSVFLDIMQFVNKQTGPVLMFVNAEDQGMSGDTIQDIKQYWDDSLGTPGEEVEDENGDYSYVEGTSPINWNRFTIVDKGYGYLRAWMDNGISPAVIIRVIRAMYQHKISDSREFVDIDPEILPKLVGYEWEEWMREDNISVNWISVAQLRRFNGAYLVGGNRSECLREVELIMNAFNIRYKRVDSLVYGD